MSTFKLHHPFSMVLAGPSSSGKTSLIKRVLENRNTLIEPPPQRVVYYYKIWQPLYEAIEDVEFKKGLTPQEELTNTTDENNLYIIDDLMSEGTESKEICSMFTEGSHHYNYSVVFLTQNIFYGGKMNRTISLNTHYMVLFKNPRDKLQITTLARQMYPNSTGKLMHYYEQATAKPYGYLLLDLKQETPEEKRMILPETFLRTAEFSRKFSGPKSLP